MRNEKPRPLSSEHLEERARTMTLKELERYAIPEELRPDLTLGIQFEGDFRVYELYVPGKRPSDARVISRARLNIYSGEGVVEVIGLSLKS